MSDIFELSTEFFTKHRYDTVLSSLCLNLLWPSWLAKVMTFAS